MIVSIRRYRCVSGLKWVREVDRILLIHPTSETLISLRATRAAVWDSLMLGHSVPRIVRLIANLEDKTPTEAHHEFNTIIDEWCYAGLLEREVEEGQLSGEKGWDHG